MGLAFHSGFSQLFTFAPDYFLRILTFILLGIFCPRPAPLRGAPRACSWRGNGMRWSATMPGSGRLRGSRFLKAHGAHTPATRADGPSAGPGDSSHERGASAEATNLGTCSKPQIHRVRNAGEYCFRGGSAWKQVGPGPVGRPRSGAREPVCRLRKRHTGARMQMRAPRARLFAQSFRTAPRGTEGEEKERQALWPT